jgi:hypothetical protein
MTLQENGGFHGEKDFLHIMSVESDMNVELRELGASCTCWTFNGIQIRYRCWHNLAVGYTHDIVGGKRLEPTS